MLVGAMIQVVSLGGGGGCIPSMSSDTGILRMSPVNSHVVCLASIPGVPSNTCTTAFDPLTSRTWPLRFEPSARVSVTISAYFGNYERKRIINNSETANMLFREWEFY